MGTVVGMCRRTIWVYAFVIFVGACLVALQSFRQGVQWDYRKPPFHNRTVVIAHYNEDLSYLLTFPPHAYTVYVYTHSPVLLPIEKHRLPWVHVRHVSPNVGYEASCYIQFILDHFDRLPDRTLFLHADAMSKHQDRTTVEIMQDIVWEGQPTEHCSVNRFIKGYNPGPMQFHPYNDFATSSLDMWRNVFETFKGPLPFVTPFVRSAQFVATRGILRNQTRELWQKALDWLNVDEGDRGKERAIGMERLWLLIFHYPTNGLHVAIRDECWFITETTWGD